MINRIKKWWYSSNREMARVRNANTNKELLKVIRRCDDSSVLKLAITRITDQAVLEDVAKNHKEYAARMEAVEKITKQEVLAYVAKNESVEIIRNKAIEKLDVELNHDLLEEVVEKLPISHTRYKVYNKLGYGEKALKTLAEMGNIGAIKQIEDQGFLADLYRRKNDYKIQIAIAEKIDDQYLVSELLKFILLKNGSLHGETSSKLLEKIDNQDLLGELFREKKEMALLEKMDVNHHKKLFIEIAKTFEECYSVYAASQLGDRTLLDEVKKEVERKINKKRQTIQQNDTPKNDKCTCLYPSLYTPPGTGWTVCRNCGKNHGEYNWNWDDFS